jgi:hypothetical protein
MNGKVIPLISRSISAMLDRKDPPSWYEPEKSIGQFRLSINGKKCWDAKGAALEAFNTVSQSIKALLESRREYIEEGEASARPISYRMWMVGRTEKSAQATIVFISKSKPMRYKAMLIVKESDLLNEYPGIALKTLSAVPAVPRSLIHNHCSSNRAQGDGDVSTIGPTSKLCGASIIVNNETKATLGGVLLVGNVWYGITANHAFSGDVNESTDISQGKAGLAFDEDSDDEDAEFVEITSRGLFFKYFLLAPR